MKKPLTSILLLVLLFSIIIPLYSFAQNGVNLKNNDKIYHRPNRSNRIFIPRFDSLFLSNKYNESIVYNQNIINDTHSSLYKTNLGIYRIATCYSKINNIDSAYYYLNKYMINSEDDRAILVDKNFDTLRFYVDRWNKVKRNIENGFVKNIGVVRDTNLAIQLFYLGIEDQKYRMILPILNQYDTTDQVKEDTNNFLMQRTCIDIIEKYGIPTISMVGSFASGQFFFILQHTELEVIEKYYPKVKKAWKKGDYDSIDYAMLTDRLLMYNGNDQIYGSQIMMRTDHKKYPNKYILYPVKDFKNVNKRRKEMGFTETVEEYVKRFPDGFIPEEYYK